MTRVVHHKVFGPLETYQTAEPCPNPSCGRAMRLLYSKQRGLAYWRCDNCHGVVWAEGMRAIASDLLREQFVQPGGAA